MDCLRALIVLEMPQLGTVAEAAPIAHLAWPSHCETYALPMPSGWLAQGETEMCQKEACHKLAWTLDACLKVHCSVPAGATAAATSASNCGRSGQNPTCALQDRALDERRIREVANFFQPYEGTELRARQGRRSGGPARVRSRGGRACRSGGLLLIEGLPASGRALSVGRQAPAATVHGSASSPGCTRASAGRAE